jgi:hypothetical protein
MAFPFTSSGCWPESVGEKAAISAPGTAAVAEACCSDVNLARLQIVDVEAAALESGGGGS